jgi:hypothetical protein
LERKQTSQLQNPQVLQFDEVVKLQPSVTESSANTRYFSIYVSQAGFGETEDAAVYLDFAIISNINKHPCQKQIPAVKNAKRFLFCALTKGPR